MGFMWNYIPCQYTMKKYLFIYVIIPYLLYLTDGEICCISSVEAYRITELLSFQTRREDDDQKLAFGERATLLIYIS